MRVIIVEDEAIAARKLQRMLEQRGLEVIQLISGVTELRARVRAKAQPDLYFFDIHLNDGIVFEALEGIEFEVPIIFTTAYDQYAIKAFKQNSIDYLLKPIDEEELEVAIAKYEKTVKPTVDIAALSNLLIQNNNSAKANYRSRISVRIGDKIRSLKLSELLMFYSERKINFLYTNEGRSYPIEQTIESISKDLDPKKFYRVNRGYIVSIDAISEVIAYSNSRLKIKIAQAPNHEIIVSRDKVKDFKAWLG